MQTANDGHLIKKKDKENPKMQILQTDAKAKLSCFQNNLQTLPLKTIAESEQEKKKTNKTTSSISLQYSLQQNR